MKNFRSVIAAAAALATLLTVAIARADVALGVSISLTGPTSALGIPAENGIELRPKSIAGEKLNVTVLVDAPDPTVGVKNTRRFITEDKVDVNLIRGADVDVEGSYVVPGPAVVAGMLPNSDASKALGVKYVAESEKADGKGLANPFRAHAFDGVIVLEKVSPRALKQAEPGAEKFSAALREALETSGRTPVSQGVLNFTATDHFGHTPETGVRLTVANGEGKVALSK